MPFAVVTVTLCAPVEALRSMTSDAVIDVLLTIVTLLAVIPVPAATCAPEMKLVPVNVTLTVVPRSPEFGDTDVSVGEGNDKVNVPLLVNVCTV